MKLEHIALQVPDPVALSNWYVQHLGCTIARSSEAPSYARFLMDDSGAIMLEVYRNPKASVPDYWSMDPLLLHVALVSANPAADRDRLVAAGARMVEDLVSTPTGDQLVMLRDPWGIALQLVRRAQPMLRG